MGWPLGKCLVRAGIPAVVMGGMHIVRSVAEGDTPFVDVFVANFWMYLLIWLAVSGLLWVWTRIMPRTPL